MILPIPDLWYHGKEESDDRSEKDEGNTDQWKVYGVYTSLIGTQKIGQKLHIDLMEDRGDIRRDECPERVADEILPDRVIILRLDAKIDPIIRKIKYDTSGYEWCIDPNNPDPGIGEHIATSRKEKDPCSARCGNYPEALYNLHEFHILDSIQETRDHLEDMAPDKVDGEYFYNSFCLEWMKEVIREKSCSKIEPETHDRARHDLYCEGDEEEVFCSSIVLLDNVFWEKVVQTLGQSEIRIDSEKSEEGYRSIDNPELIGCETSGEDDADDISERCRQKYEKIDPGTFGDKLSWERFVLYEHAK